MVFIYNAHGDVVAMTDQNGNLRKQYDYDAFGNLSAEINDPNPFRYCGEYSDSETGEVYLRARYYSPSIGRFLSEDPIHSGLNWYTYCGGNPIRFVDPLGLASTIFYNYSSKDDKKKAELMAKELKEQYGTEVFLKDFNDRDQFKTEWNSLGDSSEPIDAVVILSHGSKIGLGSYENADTKNGLFTYVWTADDMNDSSYNRYEVDALIMTGCHTGTPGGKNMASEMALEMAKYHSGINKIIAADGFVNVETKGLFNKKTTYTTSDSESKSSGFRGFKVYQHDNINGGIYDPVELGGPSYVFYGLSPMLEMANQNKHK